MSRRDYVWHGAIGFLFALFYWLAMILWFGDLLGHARDSKVVVAGQFLLMLVTVGVCTLLGLVLLTLLVIRRHMDWKSSRLGFLFWLACANSTYLFISPYTMEYAASTYGEPGLWVGCIPIAGWAVQLWTALFGSRD